VTGAAVAAPRILLCGNVNGNRAAAGLGAALAMLSEARRVRLAEPGQIADIVHTVGVESNRASRLSRRVHTVDCIPLHAGHLTPPTWWVLRERRRASVTAAWLTHGRTAGRLLVDAGVAPGDRVHCLPLLSPLESARTQPAEGQRSAVRDLLGVAPGVRLVVGVGPAAHIRRGGNWPEALIDLERRDLLVAQIRSVDPVSSDEYSVRIGSRWLTETLSTAQLLAAADVFVAAGRTLDACSAAAGALAQGLPVIAVTTDAAAELVVSGCTGFVVPPRAKAVAKAVIAQLETGLPPRSTTVITVDHAHRVADLAHTLLAVYRHVLELPAIRGLA
jgi:hypothetical protein